MPTILVVDDSAVDRRLVGGLLKTEGNLRVEYAENGAAALTRMEDLVADLVLTDLQMPEMDGWELVKAIRIHHPHVPVVLMTAHGSEAIALKALEEGAASYVPKSQLADTLRDTVEQVLGVARADRSYEHLIECLTTAQFCFALESDPALTDSLVDLVQKLVAGVSLCDPTERFRVGVALTHALLNAMYHGNLEITSDELQQTRENMLLGRDDNLLERRRAQQPYCDRKVHVSMQISPNEARFQIRDEGPGFDVSTLPAPGDPNALEWTGGRGLVLMRTFMDEVSYNGRGNEVTLVKRRTAEPVDA